MKRNHHKQPNFYLKGFKSSEEGNPKVWVYVKGKPFFEGKNEKLQNPRHLTTEKAARQKDFYAFEKEDGTKEYDKYEDLLRDKFEEPAKPVIEKIRNLEELNKTDKEIMSIYIGSMITRSEWYRETMNEFEKNYVNNLSPKWFQESIKTKVGITIGSKLGNEMYDKFKQKIGFENKEAFLEKMVKKPELFSIYIQKMNWRFFLAPRDCYFFTSDNPVWYRKLLDVDFGEIAFPISSEITLSISWLNHTDTKWKNKSKTIWQVDSKTVERVRNCIAGFALKEVYYSQKAEWLVKFINNRNNN